MPISDLRREKWAREVARWDVDRDGFVERSDFERAAERLSQLAGVEPGGRDADRIAGSYRRVWDTFWAPADRDGDGRVAEAEYQAASEWLEQQPRHEMEAIARPVIAGLFDAIDVDGDALINKDEYQAFLDAQHSGPERIDEIWPRLDADGDGRLSRDEFVALLFDYYSSDDPEAAGNFVFGR
jgi:hypothetical protein